MSLPPEEKIMDIEIPKSQPVGSGGGGFFRRSAPKHVLRFFPFAHDGKVKLSRRRVVHFMGDGVHDCEGKECPHCEEAIATKNKRLRATEKFSTAVVDMENDLETVLVFDVPVSVYEKIVGLIEDEPEAYLGNEGVDFILKYDGSKRPASQYTITPKLKGSKELNVAEEAIPDIEDMDFARDDDNGGTPAEEDEADPTKVCTFADKNGKMQTGVFTGARRGDKYCVEVDGRLQYVELDNIASCAAIKDGAEADEAIEEKEEEKEDLPDEPGDFSTGDRVTYFWEDDEEMVEGEITDIVDGVLTVDGDNGYEYEEVDPDICTKLENVPF
jgi:hypothetical protein